MSSQITFDNNYHRRQYKPRSHNVILSLFSACRIQHYYHIDQTIYNGACHSGCCFKSSPCMCGCSMARTRRGCVFADGVCVRVCVDGVGGPVFGRRLQPGLYEELNCPLSVSQGSTLPGRPVRTMAWWERSRATYACVCAPVCVSKLGLGGLEAQLSVVRWG